MPGGGFRSFQPNRARLSVPFFQGGEILMIEEAKFEVLVLFNRHVFEARDLASVY